MKLLEVISTKYCKKPKKVKEEALNSHVNLNNKVESSQIGEGKCHNFNNGGWGNLQVEIEIRGRWCDNFN